MTKKTRQVKVYSTQAECYRDIHEFYSALNKQTGARISPNVKHFGTGESSLEFIVHDHSMDTVNATTIKAAVDSVSDASDINEFMKVETYEFPADNSIEPFVLNTVEGCQKQKLIKTEYFCKMFDDVYDVIEDGLMKDVA